jgi:hypothetical protein
MSMAEESPGPIPTDLRAAFRAVMGAYWNWSRSQPEPKVTYRGDWVLISFVCDLVEQHDERMPDDLWRVLEGVVRKVDGLPDDQSYRSAARYLAQLIKERKAWFDRSG